ncbi:MAG TPA: TolC family protein, partial [Thermoanaerobaculia bacterium]|nr:TolC family protein [Thermoanaerobaculia bacterium]
HERNKVQVEVGTLAPLELVQSEAQIATNEENIITAQAAVENSADALRQFLNLPNDLWAKEIVPVTDAKTEHVAIDLNQAIQIAAQRRPDLREAEITVERNQSDAAYFRGQKKPQLDLAVGYGFAGTGAAFRETFNQVNHSDFPGWNATLTLGIPIQNRAARAQSVIADLDVEKAKVALDQLRTQVLTEVRTAARGVDTAAKQIDAAQASRNFEEKTLDAEKKKYENGMSTSFEITRVQNDLAAARSREVSAIVQYRRALTEFYRSTGKLLDQQGIAVADEEPNPRRIFGSGKGIESYETTYTPMSSAPLATPAPSSPAPASHPAPASGGGDHGKP